MAVRYYLGPAVSLAVVLDGNVVRFVPRAQAPAIILRMVTGSPLLAVFDKAQGERVTMLKMNTAAVGETRLAIHRYEASVARLDAANDHPQLTALPDDVTQNWGGAIISQLARAGINPGQSMRNTREIGQLILANQRGRPFEEADRVPIIMAGEQI